MSLVTVAEVDPARRCVVPAEVADQASIRSGDEVDVQVLHSGSVLVTRLLGEGEPGPGFRRGAHGILVYESFPGRPPVTAGQVDALLEEFP